MVIMGLEKGARLMVLRKVVVKIVLEDEGEEV